MKKATIDIGTNSCRLLIVEQEKDSLHTLYRQIVTTRIGAGITQTGVINNAAIERTITCLQDFQRQMLDWGVQSYRAVATSAVREANNQEEFVSCVTDASQVRIEVIDGQEEARLSYLGVKHGLQLDVDPLVIDLGGGSTEFIYASGDFALSIPLGAVKVGEGRWTSSQIKTLLEPIEKVKQQFVECPLVFVGGTASSLVAVKLGLEVYDSAKVHGHMLTRKDVKDLYLLLESMPLPVRRRLPGLQPERADIINSGALIMLTILNILGKQETLVSESDLMQGMLFEM